MKAWMFQGNMDRFNIDDYLLGDSQIYWTVTVPQHQRDVKIGDRVFIWRARGRSKRLAGVVAIGSVCETCKPKSQVEHPERLHEEKWKDLALEVGEVKAGLVIDSVRLTPEDGMLTMDQVKSDPVLAKMPILTVRTGSTFRLTDEQFGRLSHLWNGLNEPNDEIYNFPGKTASEGRILQRIHNLRERDPQLTAEAKRRFLAVHGGLYCQLCGFSFAKVYGSLGEGYIEAHHTRPVHRLAPGELTRIEDIIMVCSNCHRVLHLNDPEVCLVELKNLFQGRNHAGLEP